MIFPSKLNYHFCLDIKIQTSILINLTIIISSGHCSTISETGLPYNLLTIISAMDKLPQEHGIPITAMLKLKRNRICCLLSPCVLLYSTFAFTHFTFLHA